MSEPFLGPGERWEQGIDHDPRSEKLVRAMAKIDFEKCGDSMQIDIGGDGDNGETMMYLLDCHFAEIDKSRHAKDSPHITFELQPKPEKRKTEIWTVVAQGEVRLGDVRWYAPWRRYTFHPDAKTLYDAECLGVLFKFCAKETQQRKLARAMEKGHPPCMSYCKAEAPHEGECEPMEGR